MRTDIAGTADDKDFLLHQSPFRKKTGRAGDCISLCSNKGGVALSTINQSIHRG
jgi:hypothetical protein